MWTKEPIYHHVGFYVSMISLAHKKTWLVVLTMRRFDLKNQRSKSWVGSNVKVIYWVQHRINWIHIPFISCQADLAKQTSSWDETVWKLDLENPRSRSLVGPTLLQFISLSFLANWTPRPGDTAIQKFYLENPMSRSLCGHCNKQVWWICTQSLLSM